MLITGDSLNSTTASADLYTVPAGKILVLRSCWVAACTTSGSYGAIRVTNATGPAIWGCDPTLTSQTVNLIAAQGGPANKDLKLALTAGTKIQLIIATGPASGGFLGDLQTPSPTFPAFGPGQS